MGIRIKRVGVLGAGVMGQGIAAHLANAGIPSYLFDVAPRELTPDEERAGLTLEDRAVRNRISAAGYASMLKAKPALLYRSDLADLVTPCNYADDVDKLSECDWIVEVVVEDIGIKRRVFEMVDDKRRPGSVISSNTSGLSVADMAEGRSEDFRRNFCVTHFFNPVRYLRLLEIVPCEDTDPALVAAMADFGENVLGKGIVFGKDTPNFVGNRIGVFGMASVFHWMRELGLGVTEIDKIFGPAMGRPKSAVFRTADVVGLDTMAHVMATVADGASGDPWRERFEVPEVMTRLVEDGRLGAKTKAGFYKKVGSDILALDFDTLEYVEQPKVRYDSIGATRNVETASEKVAAMVWGEDPAATAAWKVTAETCIYSVQLLGEIADDIVNIDRALRWGFNYELGPFQTWDAIGVARSVERMKAEGMDVPEVVDEMLERSDGTWYVRRDGTEYFWDVAAGEYRSVPVADRLIFLRTLAERDRVIASNEGATLYDMGDGVGCVEFHTKMNSLDVAIVEMINTGTRMVNEGELVGLVVGSEAENFSVGANIGLVAMAASGKQWDLLEGAIAGMQQAFMGMKHCAGPVVVAPRGLALGGGCECVMHGASVRASAETYIGLVEVGVGLIPAAGGVKEMAFRFYGSIPHGVEADLHPLLRRLFRMIGTATVATSAMEGQELGFLRRTDRITLNPDAVLADAKADVLALVQMGYSPPQVGKVPVPGSGGVAALKIGAHGMFQGGYISEYDEHIAGKLAYALAGGDVPEGTLRSEQDLLDLEREAFLSLAGEDKTMARIMHMLQTGKPLRN